MSRLIDRMLAKGRISVWPPGYKARHNVKWLVNDLPVWANTAHVVVADNVSEYYYAETDRDRWFYHEHFPNLIPPLPVLWIESRPPSKVLVQDFGTFNMQNIEPRLRMVVTKSILETGSIKWEHLHPEITGLGALVRTFRADDAQALLNEDSRAKLKILMENYGPRQKEVAHWIECLLFMEWANEIWLCAWQLLGVDKRGTYVRVPGGWFEDGMEGFGWYPDDRLLIETYVEIPDEDLKIRVTTMAAEFLKPLLFAISFMNCRNVQQTEVVPPKEVQKARQRRGKKPLVRYHVLKIHPDHPSVRRNEGVREALHHNALHICRGHFKTYTQERPLLGKHSGTFWWPAIIRGRKQEGIVLKDYEVERE